MPFLLLSKGRAASSILLLVDAAPDDAKPLPNHSQVSLPVTSSADRITTRSTLSLLSQSSATLNAAVEEAQAILIVVLGPRIPANWANCECPIFRTWKRNLRSNLPSPSSPSFLAILKVDWIPGKQDEKITPVLSL